MKDSWAFLHVLRGQQKATAWEVVAVVTGVVFWILVLWIL